MHGEFRISPRETLLAHPQLAPQNINFSMSQMWPFSSLASELNNTILMLLLFYQFILGNKNNIVLICRTSYSLTMDNMHGKIKKKHKVKRKKNMKFIESEQEQ